MSTPNSTPAESSGLKILGRVSSLPLVASALDYGLSKYNQVKHSNALLDQSLSLAETTVAFAATNAVPVVNKLAPTLVSTVDGYACETLNKLEEKIPAIKSSPQEMYTSAQTTLTGMKDNAVSRIQSVYDTNVAPTLDSAVSLTGRAVDLLVADGEETEADKAMKGEKSVIRRVSYMSEKLRKRLLNQVLQQVRSIPVRSADAIKSMYTVDLIHYAKLVDHGKAGAEQVLNRLSKFAEENPTNPVVTLANKATTIAVDNRERVRGAYNSGRRFATAATGSLNNLAAHLSGVYTELKSTPMDRMPAVLVKQASIGAELLGGWLQNTFGHVVPLHWFDLTDRPNKETGDDKDVAKSPAKPTSPADQKTTSPAPVSNAAPTSSPEDSQPASPESGSESAEPEART